MNPTSLVGIMLKNSIYTNRGTLRLSKERKTEIFSTNCRKVGLSNLGRKQSLETRKNKSEASLKNVNIPRGERHWNWKGGVTPFRKLAYYSLEYRLWRTAVFERDDYTCIWCGQISGVLNADHIKPWCDYPELRFAIDNGRTLCEKCHKTTETYGSHK
jgi:hypothetical protein